VHLETFHELLTPAGQDALSAACELQPREVDFLRHFTSLSRRFPPDLARAALETAILRREAIDKFPFANQLFFTRPALEQASSAQVASYRARRLAGFDLLFDLGCSIGGDTLHLAAKGPTVGVDLDPLRLAMAQANIEALAPNHPVDFLYADLNAPLPITFPLNAALFFDPGRREGHRRIFSVADYRPPLSMIENWLPRCPALCVKISPGVDLEEIRQYDAEVEFISLSGELKEAVLWFGPLKTAEGRATLLPEGHTLALPQGQTSHIGTGHTNKGRLLPLSEPRAFLYEPDPSILRAGLVQHLGMQLDAAQLDPDIA
jgi:SAM-dependent methyltransferase